MRDKAEARTNAIEKPTNAREATDRDDPARNRILRKNRFEVAARRVYSSFWWSVIRMLAVTAHRGHPIPLPLRQETASKAKQDASRLKAIGRHSGNGNL